jgi:hypothetical protein
MLHFCLDNSLAEEPHLKNVFEVREPDWKLSPFTGMTRKHYIECAKYLLERAFTHVDSMETPISFPIVPGKTYPQPNAPVWRQRSADWEALERTFTLAGPLIHLDPEVEVKGIKLREYYAKHIYNALTPGHANSLPLPEDLLDATYQFTCEFGGLFKTLLLMPETIWPCYTDQQKAEMAKTMVAWGHHRTTQNNWRIFNIVTLSFLKKHGFAIDDEILKSHLLWVASYHSGNGWDLEQTYNYYTISLFIVYMMIWNRAFGDQYYPEVAETIERSARELMKTYPQFFGRDGYVNMWARSICYRTWISGGFPVSFLMKGGSPLDPGWSRRLCSGAILQFVGREDFWEKDIPALGFYGHREFAIQNYSCAGSPFIMFLPFICLALPESSPFWTATENEGMWEKLGKESKVTALDNAGIVLVNHGSSGTSEIVPGWEQRDLGDCAGEGVLRGSELFEAVVQHAFSVGGSRSGGRDGNGVRLSELGSARRARGGRQFLPDGTYAEERGGKGGGVHHIAEHGVQRGAERGGVSAGDHAQAAEQRRGVHH